MSHPRSILIGLVFCFSLAQGMFPVLAVQPTPIYETYVPGYTIPHARDVVVDEDGNAYLIASAYQDGSTLDIIVSRFDINGDLVWTRYITGNGHCYATELALDSASNVWVTGWTDASDFPMVNAMDSTLTGFRDIFLMKLDSIDGSILYSTFIGGDYTDAAQGIALNEADEIYITGYTGSTDYPVTPDAYQPGPNFPEYFYEDAFVTKLAATGDEILYSTYFGGLHDDQAREITLDMAGNIILAGYTESDDFPLQDPVQSDPNDLFIAKLSADGSTLMFGTYFGGEDLDYLGQMVLDETGLLYLVGTTRSISFPTTPGAFQEYFVGEINGCEVPFGADYNCEDIYVTKLATDGSGIIWSTFLAGTRVEEGRGLAVDSAGGVYVTGYTGSDDFPPSGMDFGAEIIVCHLDSSGSQLDFTYSIDSGSANRGNGIAIDRDGQVVFTGTVGVPASIYISKLGAFHASGVEEPITSIPYLEGSYPNPFNPRTMIAFGLPTANTVRLRVYDLGGNQVRCLIDGQYLSAGRHEISWQGRDDTGRELAAGVYFLRLEIGQMVAMEKITLLK